MLSIDSDVYFDSLAEHLESVNGSAGAAIESINETIESLHLLKAFLLIKNGRVVVNDEAYDANLMLKEAIQE